LVAAGRRDLVIHPYGRFLGLAHPVDDLLVFDAQFVVVADLGTELLAIGVVLTGVGSDISQDGQLVDVGIIFEVDSFQLGMKRFVAGARQAGISFVDLHVRIADVEVGVVVVAGKPPGHGVGDLVGLWSKVFALNEAAERFRVSEVFVECR